MKDTSFDKAEKIWKWAIKLVLAPAVALGVYAGASYLEKNYVTKAEWKLYVEEERAGLKEISGKLDTLLVRDATNGEKLTDQERRISRLEDNK
jgi:hypothetical protein